MEMSAQFANEDSKIIEVRLAEATTKCEQLTK